MTRDEIIDAARKTVAPLRAEIARLMDVIHAKRMMGYEDRLLTREYEAIQSNDREIERWTAYFAQMLATDPGPPPYIVSADRVADEFRELNCTLKSVEPGDNST
jgi:hypothetical protein